MSEERQGLIDVHLDVILLPCLIEWIKYCPLMSSVGIMGRRPFYRGSFLPGLRAVKDGMGSQKLREALGLHKLWGCCPEHFFKERGKM